MTLKATVATALDLTDELTRLLNAESLLEYIVE